MFKHCYMLESHSVHVLSSHFCSFYCFKHANKIFLKIPWSERAASSVWGVRENSCLIDQVGNRVPIAPWALLTTCCHGDGVGFRRLCNSWVILNKAGVCFFFLSFLHSSLFSFLCRSLCPEVLTHELWQRQCAVSLCFRVCWQVVHDFHRRGLLFWQKCMQIHRSRSIHLYVYRHSMKYLPLRYSYSYLCFCERSVIVMFCKLSLTRYS